MAVYFTPSEVARLIVGYLLKKNLHRTFRAFMQECPDLVEYWQILKAGRTPPTDVAGLSLTDILDEFAVLRLHVAKTGQLVERKAGDKTTNAAGGSSVPTQEDVEACIEDVHKAQQKRDRNAELARERWKNKSRRKSSQPKACRASVEEQAPDVVAGPSNAPDSVAHEVLVAAFHSEVGSAGVKEDVNSVADSGQVKETEAHNNSSSASKSLDDQRSFLIGKYGEAQIRKQLEELGSWLEETEFPQILAQNINKALHMSSGGSNIGDSDAQGNDDQAGLSQRRDSGRETLDMGPEDLTNLGKPVDINQVIEMTESDPVFNNFLQLFQHGTAIPISQLDVPELDLPVEITSGHSSSTSGVTEALEISTPDTAIINKEDNADQASHHVSQTASALGDAGLNLTEQQAQAKTGGSADLISGSKEPVSDDTALMNSDHISIPHVHEHLENSQSLSKTNCDPPPEKTFTPTGGSCTLGNVSPSRYVSRDETPAREDNVNNAAGSTGNLLLPSAATSQVTENPEDSQYQVNESPLSREPTIASHLQDVELQENKSVPMKEISSESVINTEDIHSCSAVQPALTTSPQDNQEKGHKNNVLICPDENSLTVFSLIEKSIAEMRGEVFIHRSQRNPGFNQSADSIQPSQTETKTYSKLGSVQCQLEVSVFPSTATMSNTHEDQSATEFTDKAASSDELHIDDAAVLSTVQWSEDQSAAEFTVKATSTDEHSSSDASAVSAAKVSENQSAAEVIAEVASSDELCSKDTALVSTIKVSKQQSAGEFTVKAASSDDLFSNGTAAMNTTQVSEHHLVAEFPAEAVVSEKHHSEDASTTCTKQGSGESTLHATQGNEYESAMELTAAGVVSKKHCPDVGIDADSSAIQNSSASCGGSKESSVTENIPNDSVKTSCGDSASNNNDNNFNSGDLRKREGTEMVGDIEHSKVCLSPNVITSGSKNKGRGKYTTVFSSPHPVQTPTPSSASFRDHPSPTSFDGVSYPDRVLVNPVCHIDSVRAENLATIDECLLNCLTRLTPQTSPVGSGASSVLSEDIKEEIPEPVNTSEVIPSVQLDEGGQGDGADIRKKITESVNAFETSSSAQVESHEQEVLRDGPDNIIEIVNTSEALLSAQSRGHEQDELRASSEEITESVNTSHTLINNNDEATVDKRSPQPQDSASSHQEEKDKLPSNFLYSEEIQSVQNEIHDYPDSSTDSFIHVDDVPATEVTKDSTSAKTDGFQNQLSEKQADEEVTSYSEQAASLADTAECNAESDTSVCVDDNADKTLVSNQAQDTFDDHEDMVDSGDSHKTSSKERLTVRQTSVSAGVEKNANVDTSLKPLSRADSLQNIGSLASHEPTLQDIRQLSTSAEDVKFYGQFHTLSSPPFSRKHLTGSNSPKQLSKGEHQSSASLPATFGDSVLRGPRTLKSLIKTYPSAFTPVQPRESVSNQSPLNSPEEIQTSMHSKHGRRTVIAVHSERTPFIPDHCRKHPSRRIVPKEVDYSTPSPLQDFPSSPLYYCSPSESRSPAVVYKDSIMKQPGSGNPMASPDGGCYFPSPRSSQCPSYESQEKASSLSRMGSSDDQPKEKRIQLTDLSSVERLGIRLPLSPSKRKPRRVIPVQLSSSVRTDGLRPMKSASLTKPAGISPSMDDAKIVSSTSDVLTASQSEVEAFRILKSWISSSYSKPQPMQEITSTNQEVRVSKCGCTSREACKHRKGKGRKHASPKKTSHAENLRNEKKAGKKSEVNKGNECDRVKTLEESEGTTQQEEQTYSQSMEDERHQKKSQDQNQNLHQDEMAEMAGTTSKSHKLNSVALVTRSNTPTSASSLDSCKSFAPVGIVEYSGNENIDKDNHIRDNDHRSEAALSEETAKGKIIVDKLKYTATVINKLTDDQNVTSMLASSPVTSNMNQNQVISSVSSHTKTMCTTMAQVTPIAAKSLMGSSCENDSLSSGKPQDYTVFSTHCTNADVAVSTNNSLNQPTDAENCGGKSLSIHTSQSTESHTVLELAYNSKSNGLNAVRPPTMMESSSVCASIPQYSTPAIVTCTSTTSSSSGYYTALLNAPMTSSNSGLPSLISGALRLAHNVETGCGSGTSPDASPVKSTTAACARQAIGNSSDRGHSESSSGNDIPAPGSPNGASLLRQAMSDCGIPFEDTYTTASQAFTTPCVGAQPSAPLPQPSSNRVEQKGILSKCLQQLHGGRQPVPTMSANDILGLLNTNETSSHQRHNNRMGRPRQAASPRLDIERVPKIVPKLGIVNVAQKREEEEKLQLLSQAFNGIPILPRSPRMPAASPGEETKVSSMGGIHFVQSEKGPVIFIPPSYQEIFQKVLAETGVVVSGAGVPSIPQSQTVSVTNLGINSVDSKQSVHSVNTPQPISTEQLNDSGDSTNSRRRSLRKPGSRKADAEVCKESVKSTKAKKAANSRSKSRTEDSERGDNVQGRQMAQLKKLKPEAKQPKVDELSGDEDIEGTMFQSSSGTPGTSSMANRKTADRKKSGLSDIRRALQARRDTAVKQARDKSGRFVSSKITSKSATDTSDVKDKSLNTSEESSSKLNNGKVAMTDMAKQKTTNSSVGKIKILNDKQAMKRYEMANGETEIIKLPNIEKILTTDSEGKSAYPETELNSVVDTQSPRARSTKKTTKIRNSEEGMKIVYRSEDEKVDMKSAEKDVLSKKGKSSQRLDFEQNTSDVLASEALPSHHTGHETSSENGELSAQDSLEKQISGKVNAVKMKAMKDTESVESDLHDMVPSRARPSESRVNKSKHEKDEVSERRKNEKPRSKVGADSQHEESTYFAVNELSSGVKAAPDAELPSSLVKTLRNEKSKLSKKEKGLIASEVMNSKPGVSDLKIPTEFNAITSIPPEDSSTNNCDNGHMKSHKEKGTRLIASEVINTQQECLTLSPDSELATEVLAVTEPRKPSMTYSGSQHPESEKKKRRERQLSVKDGASKQVASRHVSHDSCSTDEVTLPDVQIVESYTNKNEDEHFTLNLEGERKKGEMSDFLTIQNEREDVKLKKAERKHKKRQRIESQTSEKDRDLEQVLSKPVSCGELGSVSMASLSTQLFQYTKKSKHKKDKTNEEERNVMEASEQPSDATELSESSKMNKKGKHDDHKRKKKKKKKKKEKHEFEEATLGMGDASKDMSYDEIATIVRKKSNTYSLEHPVSEMEDRNVKLSKEDRRKKHKEKSRMQMSEKDSCLELGTNSHAFHEELALEDKVNPETRSTVGSKKGKKKTEKLHKIADEESTMKINNSEHNSHDMFDTIETMVSDWSSKKGKDIIHKKGNRENEGFGETKNEAQRKTEYRSHDEPEAEVLITSSGHWSVSPTKRGGDDSVLWSEEERRRRRKEKKRKKKEKRERELSEKVPDWEQEISEHASQDKLGKREERRRKRDKELSAKDVDLEPEKSRHNAHDELGTKMTAASENLPSQLSPPNDETENLRLSKKERRKRKKEKRRREKEEKERYSSEKVGNMEQWTVQDVACDGIKTEVAGMPMSEFTALKSKSEESKLSKKKKKRKQSSENYDNAGHGTTESAADEISSEAATAPNSKDEDSKLRKREERRRKKEKEMSGKDGNEGVTGRSVLTESSSELIQAPTHESSEITTRESKTDQSQGDQSHEVTQIDSQDYHCEIMLTSDIKRKTNMEGEKLGQQKRGGGLHSYLRVEEISQNERTKSFLERDSSGDHERLQKSAQSARVSDEVDITSTIHENQRNSVEKEGDGSQRAQDTSANFVSDSPMIGKLTPGLFGKEKKRIQSSSDQSPVKKREASGLVKALSPSRRQHENCKSGLNDSRLRSEAIEDKEISQDLFMENGEGSMLRNLSPAMKISSPPKRQQESHKCSVNVAKLKLRTGEKRKRSLNQSMESEEENPLSKLCPAEKVVTPAKKRRKSQTTVCLSDPKIERRSGKKRKNSSGQSVTSEDGDLSGWLTLVKKAKTKPPPKKSVRMVVDYTSGDSIDFGTLQPITSPEHPDLEVEEPPTVTAAISKKTDKVHTQKAGRKNRGKGTKDRRTGTKSMSSSLEQLVRTSTSVKCPDKGSCEYVCTLPLTEFKDILKTVIPNTSQTDENKQNQSCKKSGGAAVKVAPLVPCKPGPKQDVSKSRKLQNETAPARKKNARKRLSLKKGSEDTKHATSHIQNISVDEIEGKVSGDWNETPPARRKNTKDSLSLKRGRKKSAKHTTGHGQNTVVDESEGIVSHDETEMAVASLLQLSMSEDPIACQYNQKEVLANADSVDRTLPALEHHQSQFENTSAITSPQKHSSVGVTSMNSPLKSCLPLKKRLSCDFIADLQDVDDSVSKSQSVLPHEGDRLPFTSTPMISVQPVHLHSFSPAVSEPSSRPHADSATSHAAVSSPGISEQHYHSGVNFSLRTLSSASKAILSREPVTSAQSHKDSCSSIGAEVSQVSLPSNQDTTQNHDQTALKTPCQDHSTNQTQSQVQNQAAVSNPCKLPASIFAEHGSSSSGQSGVTENHELQKPLIPLSTPVSRRSMPDVGNVETPQSLTVSSPGSSDASSLMSPVSHAKIDKLLKKLYKKKKKTESQ